MTREDEIQKRLSARTPGRWVKAYLMRWCELDHFPHGKGKCDYQIHSWRLATREVCSVDGQHIIFGNDNGLHVSEADPQLIAHAPQDLEYLLSENARLRDELAEANNAFDVGSAYWSRISSELIKCGGQ